MVIMRAQKNCFIVKFRIRAWPEAKNIRSHSGYVMLLHRQSEPASRFSGTTADRAFHVMLEGLERERHGLE